MKSPIDNLLYELINFHGFMILIIGAILLVSAFFEEAERSKWKKN